MRTFFYPKSIVVVGASAKPHNLGRRLVTNLHTYKYPGNIYAVGQGGGEVEGITIVPSVSELPEAPELAAVLIPAKYVTQTIKDCGEKGIRRAVILTGGYAEIGEGGMALQEELAAVAQEYGLRFIGPNCFGLICPESGLALPFAAIRPEVIGDGSLSIVSQSGSVAMITSFDATEERIGIAKYVSIGNKVDVDEVDFAFYFAEEDDHTETIGLYLEGITRGRELVQVAGRSPKPVIALKSNISAEHAHAAKSHTASLATDDRVVEGAFRQAGIVRIKEVRDFTTASKAFKLPLMRGDNLAVVSCTGGLSVIAADECHRLGFQLPPLSDSVFEEVRKFTRTSVINLGNPLDMGDIYDNNGVLAALESALSEPQIDGMAAAIFHFSEWSFPGPDTLEIIERLVSLGRKLQKPVALMLQAEPGLIREVKQQTDLPIFHGMSECVLALSRLRDRWRYLSRPGDYADVSGVDTEIAAVAIAEARTEGLRDIGPRAMDLLGAYGIRVAALHRAATAEEAVTVAEKVGYPVAMKAVARELCHKSDMGGVHLCLDSASAVRHAFKEIENNIAANFPGEFIGVAVQPMVFGGHEFILGAKRTEDFGPVVMVGAGGVLAELLADVSFRMAPVSRYDAEQMLSEIRGAKILEGFRGDAPADTRALVDSLVRLGRLIADHEEIQEIDVNPIKVLAATQGAVAVDARVVLGS